MQILQRKIKIIFLLCLFVLLIIVISACAQVKTYDGPRPDVDFRYEAILVFENSSNFMAIKNATVTVKVKEPTKLITPENGIATTDSQGATRFVFSVPAHYDEAVLKAGDLVVDYPIEFEYTIKSYLGEFIGSIADVESLAIYHDPLYHGLNREPSTEPIYINITLP